MALRRKQVCQQSATPSSPASYNLFGNVHIAENKSTSTGRMKQICQSSANHPREGRRKDSGIARVASADIGGRLNLRAEMRGRMPRPARIVQDSASKGDKVGVTSSENGFRLLEFGDQPNGDHRHSCCGFDRTSERNLVSRPHWYLLMGVRPPLDT